MDRRDAHLLAGDFAPVRSVLHRSDRGSAGGIRDLIAPCIYWFELDHPDWDIESLRRGLPEEERRRCERLLSPLHQRRQTVACVLLRQLLAPLAGIPAAELRWQRGAHGKPFLEERPGLHFNLSHSEGYAALGVSASGEIGLDLEDGRRRVDWRALAPRYFAPAEAERVLASDRPDQLFFEVWTAKEAYIKAIGDGLTHPLDQFLTLDRQGNWLLTDLKGLPLTWKLQRPRAPWAGVAAAWAARDEFSPRGYHVQPGGACLPLS